MKDFFGNRKKSLAIGRIMFVLALVCLMLVIARNSIAGDLRDIDSEINIFNDATTRMCLKMICGDEPDEFFLNFIGLSLQDVEQVPNILDIALPGQTDFRQKIAALYGIHLAVENGFDDYVDVFALWKAFDDWYWDTAELTMESIAVATGIGIFVALVALKEEYETMEGLWQGDPFDALGIDMVKSTWVLIDEYVKHQADKDFLNAQVDFYLRQLRKIDSRVSYDKNSFTVPVPFDAGTHDLMWATYKLKANYLGNDPSYQGKEKPKNPDTLTPELVQMITAEAWSLAYANYLLPSNCYALKKSILDLMKNPHKLLSAQSFEITPNKEKYFVGDILSGNFTITNQGTVDVMLKEICIAGRDENMHVHDFTKYHDVTVYAGKEYSYTGSFTIPKTGPFWFFPAYLPENQDWVAHAEVKNIYAHNKPAPLLPEPKLPDLAIEYLNAPSSAELGESINISFRIKNKGKNSSGKMLNNTYLAESEKGHDYLIQSLSMNLISSGSSRNDSVNIKIPIGMTPGYYYLILYTDANEKVAESNEENNTASKRIQLTKPEPVITTRTIKSWEFNSPENFQGWEVWGIEIHNGLRQTIVDFEGHLVLNPDKDPRMFAPSLSISTADCDTLEFRMISHCKDTNGKAYINLGSKTAIGSFTVKPGQWHTYEIYFGDQSVWPGRTIEGMRIDPVENGDDNDYDDIAFDWIKLKKRNQAPVLTIMPPEKQEYYSLCGIVYENGKRLENTKISLSGNNTKTTYTDSNGEYSFSLVEKGTYIITPFKQGYVFEPSTCQVNISSNIINQNFQAEIPKPADKTAPNTAEFIFGQKGSNDWYITNIKIKLSSIDNDSVKHIKYRINSESWQEYFQDLIISDQGTTTVRYYAQDNAGNTEPEKSIQFKIDSARPETPVLKHGEEYSVNTDGVLISWTASDKGSGIVENQYAVGTSQGSTDIISWTSTGTSTQIKKADLSLESGQTYFFSVQTKDKAGNWSNTGYLNGIMLDPSLSVQLFSFTAVFNSDNASIILTWTTASEVNNLGFNIFRSESQNGTYQKINSSLIPGHGTTESQHNYSFVDDTAEHGKDYFYYLEDLNFSGSTGKSQIIKVMPNKKAVIMIGEPWISLQNKLYQNYPNPFNPETWIPFELANSAQVEIQIFDVSGRLVRVLDLGEKPAGFYKAKNKSAYWNGKNKSGEFAVSGIYFYQIRANDFIAVKRMILIK